MPSGVARLCAQRTLAIVTDMISEGFMAPFAARLDRFVRWFVNSSPEAMIELPQLHPLGDESAFGDNPLRGVPARRETRK